MKKNIPLQAHSAHANQLQSEQTSLIEVMTSKANQQYPQLLQGMIEEKHDQVERLEWKIGAQIEQTEEALQQLHGARPGLFSRSNTKVHWERNRQRLEQRLESLRSRHEHIRETSEATSISGTRIQELAAQKLAHRDPEIVSSWYEHRENERKEKSSERAKIKMDLQKTPQGRTHGLTLGRELE